MTEIRLVKEGSYTFSVYLTLENNVYRLRILTKRLLEMKGGCLALARTHRKVKEAKEDYDISIAKKKM